MKPVEIDDKKVSRLLKDLERRVKNRRPVMREIGEIMMLSIQRNFEDEGRPKKWAGLSPAYKKARYEKGYDGKILQETGKLLQSINPKATNDSVTVGTAIEYAVFHQDGKGRMHRPFLMFQKEDVQDIKETLTDYIMKRTGL